MGILENWTLIKKKWRIKMEMWVSHAWKRIGSCLSGGNSEKKNGFGGCMREWKEWKWAARVGTHHLVEFSMLSYAHSLNCAISK